MKPNAPRELEIQRVAESENYAFGQQNAWIKGAQWDDANPVTEQTPKGVDEALFSFEPTDCQRGYLAEDMKGMYQIGYRAGHASKPPGTILVTKDLLKQLQEEKSALEAKVKILMDTLAECADHTIDSWTIRAKAKRIHEQFSSGSKGEANG